MKDVTVVLAHGAWADGSSWARVVTALKAEGTTVSAAPLPLTSLADDVAAVNRSLNRTERPIVLVGHAYAIQRYRPLHCGEDQAIVGGRVLRKRHYCSCRAPALEGRSELVSRRRGRSNDRARHATLHGRADEGEDKGACRRSHAQRQ